MGDAKELRAIALDDLCRDDITPAIVRELIDYDPLTGNLTWKKRSVKWFVRESNCRAWNTRHAGKPALTYKKEAYLGGAKEQAEGDAQLITLLVNHYPELKAEIERLRAALNCIASDGDLMEHHEMLGLRSAHPVYSYDDALSDLLNPESTND